MEKNIKCPKGHKEVKRSENSWGIKTGPGKIHPSGYLYYCSICKQFYSEDECTNED